MKKIRLKVIFFMSLLSITGCATNQYQPIASNSTSSLSQYPTPVCYSKEQCEAMWLSASQNISLLTRMKVRLMTDTYIETFDGTRRAGGLMGAVAKRPNPDGSYDIEATISCFPQSEACRSLTAKGLSLFNQLVGMSGSSFKKPAQ